MKILIFPHSPANPYQRLLASGLEKEGVEVSFDKDLFRLRALLPNPSFDLLHLHWLPLDVLRRSLLLIKLLALRMVGVPVVWTVHNLFHHEGGGGGELLYRKIISRISSRMICHCEEAKRLIVQVYGVEAGKVAVIPHGNYIGVYPEGQVRKEARESLGVGGEDLVFLYFGMINDYKGLPQLIGAFKQLDRPATLIIAGSVSKQDLKSRLENLGRGDKRIKFIFKFIPDEAVAAYFNAADCIVLPYADILTSGTAALAASFGKAVIAPKIGCLPEQLEQGGALLYNPEEENGLFCALEAAFDEDLEELGKDNLQKAKEASWSKVVKGTAEVYEGVII